MQVTTSLKVEFKMAKISFDLFPKIIYWADAKSVINLLSTCRTANEHVNYHDLCISKARRLILGDDNYFIWEHVRNNLHLAKCLLKLGVDVHAHCNFALRNANKRNYKDVEQMLVEHGAIYE